MDDHIRDVLCRRGWCGLCYANVRGRAATRGHLRYCAPRRAKELPVVSYLRRIDSGNGDSSVPANAPPGEWGVLYPALYEFLSSCAWASGEPRAPGSLTLFTDGRAWKACLNDKAQSRVAFVTASDPEHLLHVAEEGLVQGLLDWRDTRYFGQKKK
jgi:hypothetical protein